MSLGAVARPGPTGPILDQVPAPSMAVHITLAGCSVVLLAFCLLTAPPGAIHTGFPMLEAVLVLLGPLLIPAAYWHQRGSPKWRDAALMLPWSFLLAALIAQTAATAATFQYPLRDLLWKSLDERLGFRGPLIMAWTAQRPFLNSLLGRSYGLLHPFLMCGILLPALLGRREHAQRFVLANALAFVLALPCMVLLPAIGPWVAWNFAPDPGQQVCELTIRTLREGSLARGFFFGGTVCLPSFHVFWAVVTALALQPFRLLRFPAILMAGLITVSTLTTGWHYGVDVIAGLLLAAVSSGLASVVVSAGGRVKADAKIR